MKAPHFTLPYLDEDELFSLLDYVGMPVMVTFWVSWCPDCRRMLEKLETFYKHMDEQILKIVTIHVTGREPTIGGKQYLYDHGLTLPVLSDEGSNVYDSFRCMGVPTTVLIDSKGYIFRMFHDKDSFQSVMEGMTELLSPS